MSTLDYTLTAFTKNSWEMERAIRKGFQPDCRTLVWAIGSKHEDVVLLAIKAGASYREWDSAHPDRTTLSYAAIHANPTVVKKVIDLGALPGANTLTWAIRGGNLESILLVIRSGALSDDSTRDAADRSKNREIIEILQNHNLYT